jgi:hypothetical protein
MVHVTYCMLYANLASQLYSMVLGGNPYVPFLPGSPLHGECFHLLNQFDLLLKVVNTILNFVLGYPRCHNFAVLLDILMGYHR